MRLEISPEPTPEERAVIEAVVARLYGRRGAVELVSTDRSKSTAPSWRELARLEALDNDVQKDPRR